jgi:uroporphyrinogen-III synthase
MPDRIISPVRVTDPMRVLVTRPLPDAETTARDLRQRGHEPLLAPLLTIHFADWTAGMSQAAETVDAIVATSPNGIRGLLRYAESPRLRRKPLFVAGDASARLAQSLGFTDVRSASGDLSAIIDRIRAELPPASSLFYAAGRDRSGDLKHELVQHGFGVDLIEVYEAVTTTTLPDAIVAGIVAREIDRILIFSARTAEALVAALSAADLLAVSRIIPIHAISRQAAEPLISADFRTIVIALRPDAAELLDTLDSSR